MGYSRTTLANLPERFWSKVGGSPARGCWPWLRAGLSYGYFWLPNDLVPGAPNGTKGTGRMHPSNRVAYYLSRDVWPRLDRDVCHTCDNPPCCNPGHLFLGTTLENMQDMAHKGRDNRMGHKGGENHPSAKITDAQVLAIISRVSDGEHPSDLAAEFGVSDALVYAYRTGRRRKSVTAP